MQVRLEEKDGVSIFRVTGDIDLDSSPEVKKSFDKRIGEEASKIIVNLEEVAYIDSSGIATLIETLKNMRVYGGKLKLTNLSAKVKSLFEITKLDKFFDILDVEEDAITSFAD